MAAKWKGETALFEVAIKVIALPAARGGKEATRAMKRATAVGKRRARRNADQTANPD